MNNHAADHRAETIDALTKAIGATSSDEELTKLHIERGNCYLVSGDDGNSVRDFLDALETATSKSDMVHLKSMIALTLARKDEKEQAIFWALSAVDQDPQNAEGYHTLGLVCDVCGFQNVAVESLERAVHLDPDRWDSIRLLGSCLRENGRLPDSIETLSRYATNNPAEPLGLYELGWSLHVWPGENNLYRAKELYKQALEGDPSPSLREIIERKLHDIAGRENP